MDNKAAILYRLQQGDLTALKSIKNSDFLPTIFAAQAPDSLKKFKTILHYTQNPQAAFSGIYLSMQKSVNDVFEELETPSGTSGQRVQEIDCAITDQLDKFNPFWSVLCDYDTGTIKQELINNELDAGPFKSAKEAVAYNLISCNNDTGAKIVRTLLIKEDIMSDNTRKIFCQKVQDPSACALHI